MKDIKKLFRELRFELFKIAFLNSLIDSAIVFFILMIIFTFFSTSYIYALGGAVAFLVIDIAVRMKRLKFQHIEAKNPEIKDILSTAKENIGIKNEIVSEMFSDLIKRVKQVSLGTMLNNKTFSIKIAVTVCLAIALIFLAAQNISFQKLGVNLEDINIFKEKKPASQIYEFELNESEDIYGEASQIKLGTKEVNLNINPDFNEFNLNEIQEEEELEFIEGSYPSDIGAVSDVPSEENLPKDAEIAIEYNLKLQE